MIKLCGKPIFLRLLEKIKMFLLGSEFIERLFYFMITLWLL